MAKPLSRRTIILQLCSIRQYRIYLENKPLMNGYFESSIFLPISELR